MSVKVAKNAKKPPKKPAVRVGETTKTPGQIAYEAYRKALEEKNAPINHRQANQFVTVKSPALCEAFITYLSKGFLPATAAEKTGISRATAFNWRKEDPEFAKAWEAAIEEATDLLEQEIQRRAHEGVDRPVFQGGECVGFTKEYSDNLAALLLQGRRPHYRKHQPEENKADTTIKIYGGLPEGTTVKIEKKD